MQPSNETTPQSLGKGMFIVVVFLVGVGAAFFASYGSLCWWEAWMLLGLWAAYFLFMLTVVNRLNPGLVKERSESLEKFSQRWDRAIVGIYQIASLGLYITSGLDAGRFGWTGGVPGWVKWGAFPFVLFVYFFPTWAVFSNPFTSGAVRIQEERGHQVIAKGPYRWVRHPMYLGTVVYGICFPLFLESCWALIPGLIVVVLFVIRTALEDRYLQDNLPGYAAFCEQTRYRLLPGIW